jgi:hypothetical protein
MYTTPILKMVNFMQLVECYCHTVFQQYVANSVIYDIYDMIVIKYDQEVFDFMILLLTWIFLIDRSAMFAFSFLRRSPFVALTSTRWFSLQSITTRSFSRSSQSTLTQQFLRHYNHMDSWRKLLLLRILRYETNVILLNNCLAICFPMCFFFFVKHCLEFVSHSLASPGWEEEESIAHTCSPLAMEFRPWHYHKTWELSTEQGEEKRRVSSAGVSNQPVHVHSVPYKLR